MFIQSTVIESFTCLLRSHLRSVQRCNTTDSMPRRQPQSLYRACLVYVAGNMHVPCSENTSAISELPQTISEDIVVALQRCQPVDYAVLCHVLGNLLRFVFLSRRLSPTEEIAYRMLSQLRHYGNKITALHLPLTEAQYDTFVTTLPSLRRLRNLVLHVNDLTDSMAEAITHHCPDLIILCLYGARFGNYLLDVITNDRTYVTHVDFHVVQSILERLGLRVFRISFLARAVLSLPATTRLQLTELTIYKDLLDTPGTLSHVITSCPNLRRMSLFLADGIQIEPLARLAFLEDLTIIVLNSDFSLDFSDVIQRVLRCVGWRLKRLRLNVPVLDLTSVVRFCPALHELHVKKLLQIVNHERRETRSVEQLQALRISLVTPMSLDPHRLCGLLQDYGNLTRVFLHRCYLADFELRELISSGTFSKLETFQLVEVYGFRPGSLHLLLMAQSILVVIRLIRCPSVSLADVDELRVLARRLNLFLGIEFGSLDDQRI
ncbi:unnamed protein product [Ixodes persulcatus]